jgi:ubiquinone/menaquinone biosynthesis C-methylase UbiE
VSSAVREAYDAIAPEYDRQLAADAWMRRILWQRYRTAFRPGHQVLDVGCGTGTDAIFLAQQGIQVTGIDLSPAMVARAESKARARGLADAIRLSALDLAGLHRMPDGEFDGIISSYASLNTLPTLTQFATDAARLLRPNGRMILHLLNGRSLWEWTGLVSHGRWAEARQLGTRRARNFAVGGRPVQHYMPRADEAYALYFARHFRLCRVMGLGVIRPPRPLPGVPKAALEALERLDALIGPYRPFIDWGRFTVLELERNSDSAPSAHHV